jgi:hypothetical protein
MRGRHGAKENAMNPNASILRSAGIGLSLLVVVLSGSAMAQGTEQQRSDCMGDAFRFCSAQIPDVSAIEACLAGKEPELSPACQVEFKPVRKTRIRREHFQS